MFFSIESVRNFKITFWAIHGSPNLLFRPIRESVNFPRWKLTEEEEDLDEEENLQPYLQPGDQLLDSSSRAAPSRNPLQCGTRNGVRIAFPAGM